MALLFTGNAQYLLRNPDGAILLHGVVHKGCEPLPPRTGVPQRWYRLSLYAFIKTYASNGVTAPAKQSSEGRMKIGVNRVYLWRETYPRDELPNPKMALQTMADLKVCHAWGAEYAWIGPKQRWPKPEVTWS